MAYPYEFQIGPTLAGMTYLPRWGIAWPDECNLEQRSLETVHISFDHPPPVIRLVES